MTEKLETLLHLGRFSIVLHEGNSEEKLAKPLKVCFHKWFFSFYGSQMGERNERITIVLPHVTKWPEKEGFFSLLLSSPRSLCCVSKFVSWPTSTLFCWPFSHRCDACVFLPNFHEKLTKPTCGGVLVHLRCSCIENSHSNVPRRVETIDVDVTSSCSRSSVNLRDNKKVLQLILASASSNVSPHHS